MVEHPPEVPPLPQKQKFDSKWLRDWQKRNRFTNADGARRLGLSESTFRRQKTGRSRVGAQTVLLAMYTDIHQHNWLNLAEMAVELAKLTGTVPYNQRKSIVD